MNAIFLKANLVLFFLNPFQVKSHLIDNMFLYNGKEINIKKDNLQKLQENFSNHFNVDRESQNVDDKDVTKYVNIKEGSLFVKKMVITPALYFDLTKSNDVLQKASLVFFIDNAATDNDFKAAVKRISEILPLLNAYKYTNKQSVYYHGLKIEINKRKFDDGYQIQIDIQ